jgi:hypothetical protein
MRIILLLALLSPFAVQAACQCTCVDAKFVSLCDSPKDKPRSCGQNFCPKLKQSAADAPPLPNTPVPPGARNCRMAQVYQHMKARYEWQRICE